MLLLSSSATSTATRTAATKRSTKGFSRNHQCAYYHCCCCCCCCYYCCCCCFATDLASSSSPSDSLFTLLALFFYLSRLSTPASSSRTPRVLLSLRSSFPTCDDGCCPLATNLRASTIYYTPLVTRLTCVVARVISSLIPDVGSWPMARSRDAEERRRRRQRRRGGRTASTTTTA